MKITRARTAGSQDVLLILAAESSPWNELGLSEAEQATAKAYFAQTGRELLGIPRAEGAVLIAYSGKRATAPADLEAYRRLGADAAEWLNRHRFSSTFALSQAPDEARFAFLEGLALASYQFRRYRSNGEGQHSLASLRCPVSTLSNARLEELQIVVEATCLARDLVNEPLSFLTAAQFAREMQKMGRKAGFKTQVFNKKKIEELRMGGLLAVNQGSPDPPSFTIMEWKPAKVRNKKPLVLVGKGVVYDTGGLSLKQTLNGMDFMKCDMAGGAAVAGALYAVARAGLPVHVIGLVPATDNRPGGNAYVPGDVVRMMSGKTVEVLNTDAEGRMLLADALHYAKRYQPELVIDLATLTGAAAMAIGPLGMVAMGTAGRHVMERLAESGHAVHERLAEFPFWPEYGDEIRSEIADIKNVGGGFGGSITAGKFLEHFTDYPWIHLDIAGPAWQQAATGYRTRFGTGVGVRLLYHFIKHYAV
jgi:leucyl aminopeptidase